ncbi:hypothetical protein CKM354_000704700 [Cercospora kikuchii]|uniref:Major facilitator superfamily (MFS) profile domain-containing protein n=1 Tax=Cercospora kikuchii TaxID=84275 RepID=A0A9P3CJ80_9PEZI|nr:uncharacterized protein CKM354_000704700 [Cercospora kikuchii]GIZ43834.1 hypothetical protein CKM354_000704700 [Cercospora kikuchii]
MTTTTSEEKTPYHNEYGGDDEKQRRISLADSAAGTDEELMAVRSQAWGKNGLIYMWLGIGLMWTIFELDNATVYNYQNFATSEFQQVSLLGALSTAGTIVSAVLKPPVAKVSDIIGRAETYCFAVALYILSYVLCASSNEYNQYAASYIIYCIGQTSMQILNQLIVADITTSRWRGLANGLVNLPFMIIPWIAAFIADSALNTVGWRWGIGMFAIIMPVCSVVVIMPLLYFQRRMKQFGHSTKAQATFISFFSKIDIGGMTLLVAGFALVLLPLALAGTTPSRWDTAWVPALIAVGGVCLIALGGYEWKIAANPIVPLHFFKNISLVLAWIMGLMDAFAFSATHTYMYTWAVVVHEFSVRDASFLTFTAGCMQVLTGLVAGALMYKTRRYKWLLVIGVAVRLLGYGVMLRLRGANNSVAELFIVQLVQGFGSGIVLGIFLVVAQIVVPRSELSQSTALELLFIYMGNALGSTAAGAIYTNSFAPRLRDYLPASSDELVNTILNTFTEEPFANGTPERTAINAAYSDVMRYMTYAALGASVFGIILVWFLPNLQLSDKHNLAGEMNQIKAESSKRADEGMLRWWWRTGRLW